MSSVTADGFGRVVIHFGEWRCEDCDDRQALKEDGSPAYHPQLGFRLTSGCAGCAGSGKSSTPPMTVTLEDAAIRARLTMKQAYVLRLRLGLKDGRRYKQREIAALLDVDRSAVSHLEARARVRLEDFAVNVTKKRHFSTRVEAQSRDGGASVSNGRHPHRPHVYRAPRQITTGSTCWDVYFDRTDAAHTYREVT